MPPPGEVSSALRAIVVILLEVALWAVSPSLVSGGLGFAGALGLRGQSRSDLPTGAGIDLARSCTRVVSPPVQTGRAHTRRGLVQHLVDSLKPRQVGCLRGGEYLEDVTVSRSGIGLRSYPGERARLVGRLWVGRGARDDVISGLTLDGRNAARLPSPTVNGDAISFLGDDVTNEGTSICFLIGSAYGRARGTVIERSRIHNCGVLPATNHEHGIYVERATNTRIVRSLIYDNADRGIQLYPDAQHTVVERDVIDGNGEGIIFSGDEGTASSHNLVRHNVISGSRIRADVESWYPPGNPMGTGNVVRANCLWGGRGGTIDASAGGFAASSNRTADPLYADAATGDFRIGATSPCAHILQRKLPPARRTPGR